VYTTGGVKSDDGPAWLRLLTRGMWDFRTAVFLCAAVKARLNLLVSGEASTGKTTLVNVLSGFSRLHHTPVILEDLRRPDTLPVLDARREGVLATVVAESPQDAIDKLAAAASPQPVRDLLEVSPVHAAFDLIVHMQPSEAGRRQIREIVWLRKRMGPGDKRRLLWQKTDQTVPSLDPFATRALMTEDNPEDKRLERKFVNAFSRSCQWEFIKDIVAKLGDEDITARDFRSALLFLQGERILEDSPLPDEAGRQVVVVADALRAWKSQITVDDCADATSESTVPAGYWIETMLGRRWIITRQPWYIGRSDSSANPDTALDAELGARYIHHQHCRITFDARRATWMITRIGRIRGTDVVGKARLSVGGSVQLEEDDEIRLAAGRVRLWFRKE